MRSSTRRSRTAAASAIRLAIVGAATRLPIGTLLRVPETRELFQQIAGEVASVARSEGITLPGDIAEQATPSPGLSGPGRSPRYTMI